MANSSPEPATAHGARQIESAGEHRTPCQQRLLGVVEQVVGPLHGVAQRLMALQTAPRSDQQPEPVVEPVAHLGDRHRQHARCGQLDRQRDAVEAPADLDDSVRVIGRQRDSGRHALGRGRRTALRRPSRLRVTSSDGTGQSCSSATRRPSRLVARIVTVADCARIVSIISAAASTTCSQLSNTSSRDRPSNAAATLSARLIPGCWVIPSTAATASGTAAGITDGGQFDHPHPVGELVRRPRGDLQRQPCLADPADTGQRHQAMRLQRRLQLGDFGLAADEAGGRRPEVARRRIERLQRRELGPQPGGPDLEHVDRLRDVAQPSRPKVDQITPLTSPAVAPSSRI